MRININKDRNILHISRDINILLEIFMNNQEEKNFVEFLYCKEMYYTRWYKQLIANSLAMLWLRRP